MRISSSDTKQPLHNPETVLFTTNQTILLGKIHAENIDIDLRIVDMSVVITEVDTANASKKEIYSGIHRWYRKLITDDKQYLMKIVLPKPILIEAKTQYEIRVHILSDLKETDITTDRTWEPIVQLEDGLEIEFHRNPSSKYDTSTVGWITRLDFNKLSEIN